jgi:hypothetical protein
MPPHTGVAFAVRLVVESLDGNVRILRIAEKPLLNLLWTTTHDRKAIYFRPLVTH